MPDHAIPTTHSRPPDWDSGQRHVGRPWQSLLAGLVLVALNVVAVCMAPFLLAQSDEPLAVWTVLALLAGMLVRWLLGGVRRPVAHLEQLILEPAGIVLQGAGQSNPVGAFKPLRVEVAWSQVRAIAVLDALRKGETGAVVELSLTADTVLGREFRLVHARRQHAEALAARAQMLQGQVGARPT